MVYSQVDRRGANQVDDEVGAESCNFNFQLNATETRGPSFGKTRFTPQARRLSGVGPTRPAGGDRPITTRGRGGIEDGPTLLVETTLQTASTSPFLDRTSDINAIAVHGLASCKGYFIFRNSGPRSFYRRHSSTHHVWMTVGHLTIHTYQEVRRTIMPFREPPGQKPAGVDDFERGTL